MKFAKKYKLVSATGQRAPPPVPLPPQEAGLQNYERAASALAENITDRSLPADVALENHAFLRGNYMEALSRIMRDRNQIVDRLDSIARLISLNTPAGGAPTPLAGIRDAREAANAVQHERTPPPFEEREENIPGARRRRLPQRPSRQLERSPAAGRRRPRTRQQDNKTGQDLTKLSPFMLRKAGVKDWAKRK